MEVKKKRRRFDLQTMKGHAEKLGGKCLSDKYVNSTFRLLFTCKNGHRFRATPLEVMGKKSGGGKWCPDCRGF